jgi:hypothetical protein
MKQQIKSLSMLVMLVLLFNTSQEKGTCLVADKCPLSLPVISQEAEQNDASNDDELVPLSPISRFILIKY